MGQNFENMNEIYMLFHSNDGYTSVHQFVKTSVVF